MIIGIDGNEANVDKRVGVSEFAFELINNFYNFRNSKSIDHKFQIYLKGKPLGHMPKEESWFDYKIVSPRPLWTQFGLPLYLFIDKNKPDVFFSPTHYAPRFARIPRVISIMDLAFLKYPETFNKDDLYQLINWTKYSVKKSKSIITISKSAKDDIISRYGLKSDTVNVVYPGIKSKMNTSKTTSKEVLEKYNIDKKYILFVSTLQPRKNLTKLIEALARVRENVDIDLVVVGKKGWKYEEILEAPKTFNVESHVKFLNFVPDDELEQLYKNAELFVMPSLYEGFGLPILEAMQQGCPVATSNISSLPEAGGDAASYFDPESVEDMSSVIEGILTDEKKRKAMKEKGFEQVKKFSWEKSAKEALKVLESVV